MIPEIGQLALSIALCVALVQGTLPLLGSLRNNRTWTAVARPAAQTGFVLVALAFACLTHAFATNDFSVAYVAANSNTALPWHYRVTAVWSGHEGSLLLWMFMLAAWTAVVSMANRHLPEGMTSRVLGVLGLVSAGFLAFLLFASNPFLRLDTPPAEGRDLNPLLQDPGMIFHPPLLYMGYVGFSVAFAFGIAALLAGRLDAAWARWSRPWTTVAWCFLTLGIALGSFWAYYELGWGGWWFWDPVENASFMPWLVGTALLHSLAVSDKRGSFRGSSVLLAIGAFALSLLGTFLVRSGVLSSVHAFAMDPKRWIFILVLLALTIGGSLAVYVWRAPAIAGGGRFDVLSRESALAGNNLLLTVAAGCVMLGTVYPLALDALGAGKISVGAPYFETVFFPLIVPAIALMGVGVVVPWKRGTLTDLMRDVRWAAAASVIAGVLAIALTPSSWRGGLAVALAAWVLTTCATTLSIRMRMRHGLHARLRALTSASRAHYGMLLAHAGVAVFIFGVAIVKTCDREQEVRMKPGDTVQVGNYVFRFDRLAEVRGPNYTAARATLSVHSGGEPIALLYPEKRVYEVRRMVMTEAAIDRGFARDLYSALGERLDSGAWIVRLQVKPFVSWIWAGCTLMALGGLLAASDRRYRWRTEPRPEAIHMRAVRQAAGG